MILVDTSVIVDVFNVGATWNSWSAQALADAADQDDVAINPVIYAEIAAGFPSVAALEAALQPTAFVRLPLPYDAGFLAGHAFVEYRRRGGSRTSPLPDFYIGAHAAIAGLRLLTRDARRYAGYFPGVKLIAP